jgi:hypothetical protein
MTAGEWTEAAEEPKQQEEEIDSSVDESEAENAGLDAEIDVNKVVELEEVEEEAGDS